jgi:hypothetical protein
MHSVHADVFEAHEKGSARQSEGRFTAAARAKGQRAGGIFVDSQLEVLSAGQQLR